MTDDIHLPSGNRFDEMRIDLLRAYEVQDKVLARRQRRSVRVSFPRNALHSWVRTSPRGSSTCTHSPSTTRWMVAGTRTSPTTGPTFSAAGR